MQPLQIPLAVLLLCLVASIACAQKKDLRMSRYSNSLGNNKAQSAPELLEEATGIMETDPQGALNKVQDALAISIERNDVFNEGKCYLLLGNLNENIAEWSLALENFVRAKALFLSNTRTAEYRKALKGIGQANLNLLRYTDAIDAYTEAAGLSKGDEQQECNLGISEAYYRLGQYTKALEVIDEETSGPDVSGKIVTNQAFATQIDNQRAKIYARTNNVGMAQNIYQNSARAVQMPKAQAEQKAGSTEDTKKEIADVLHDNKQYDEEIALRKLSIEVNTEKNKFDEVSEDKLAISKTLVVKGETNAAIRELEEAARIADTTDNPATQTRAYLALADLYEKNGRSKEALSAYRKYSDAATRNEQRLETRSAERSDLIRKQKDIEELTKGITISQHEDTIAQGLVNRQRLIIYGLMLILVIVSFTTVYMYRSSQARQRANHLLALKSLRSQMNPHFIFNALNSVNHFVAQNDERTANKFLSEFSRLMRLVLEHSQENFIPLYKEEEIIALYLKLEHYRFRDKFEYTFTVDDQINKETFVLPPMLIQPYIENAVWHGLRYKTGSGTLSVTVRQENNGYIEVEITDDGIGRKRSAEVKTDQQKKHNSTGIRNMEERLDIINRVYRTRYTVQIEDLDKENQTGTRVRISLPPTETHHAA